MKIDKITICNLTSIGGEQVVDFRKEPLRSAGLFAITGDTGSGKTTLLDAICLALFNKSPRFDAGQSVSATALNNLDEGSTKKIGTQDVRNLLRQGCKEGYSKIEFTVNGKDRYEATWNVNLNRNNNYNRVSRTLKKIAPAQEDFAEKEIQSSIINIIGLDYEQFTRTVILAQNSFANFLNAKDVEKSALLEKLTGTEIYGKISQKIFELTKEAEAKKTQFEQMQASLKEHCLNENELAKANETFNLLDSKIKNTEQQLAVVKERLKWFGNYDRTLDEVKQLEVTFNEVNKAYVSMGRSQQELERYDKVQTAQPYYQKIKMREMDIVNLTKQEDETNKNIEIAKEKVRKVKNTLNTAIERYKNAEEQQHQRQPILKQGYALTGEIQQTEILLNSLEKELNIATQQLGNSQSNLTNRKKDYEITKKRLETLNQRQQVLSVNQSMFENMDLVHDKFNQLSNLSETEQSLRKQLEHLQKKKAENTVLQEAMTKELNIKSAREQTISNDLKIHYQANQGHNGAVLQDNYSNHQSTLALLENAKLLWKRISETYEDIAERSTQAARSQMNIEQTEKQIEKAETEVERLSIHFKFLEKQHTISQSKEIILMRRELQEGKACPVCGATHHPYHTEDNRALGEVNNANDSEYAETEIKLERKKKELNSIRESQSAARSRLASEIEFLKKRQEQLEEDTNSWNVYSELAPSFADCSSTVNREARRIMIEQLIENTNKTKISAKKELDTYNRHQIQINELNLELAQIEAQLTSDRIRLNEIDSTQKVIVTQTETLQKQLQESERNSGEVYERLDSLVTLPAWFSEWMKNRDSLRLRIASYYEDWQNVQTKTEATLRDITTLELSMTELTSTYNTAQNNWQSCKDKYSHTSELLENKKRERSLLFGEQSPEEEAIALEKNIKEAQNEVSLAQTNYNNEIYELQHLNGTGKNLQENRLKSQEEISKLKSELDLWILKFNGKNSPIQFYELEQIFNDSRDWNELRKEIQELKEQQKLTESSLNNARRRLIEMKSMMGITSDEEDSKNREFVSQQQKELENVILQLSQSLLETKTKIEIHKQYEAQVLAMDKDVKETTDKYNEWNCLNQLLGSADGKKFRELAQSYTFQLLVAQANKQLTHLSPRYYLNNIKGTLALEIIDHDMCDERRYINSLSGGETFVVSLSLALGLSSLSSNSLAIGSLFIDEGFGNLDHNSLDLVMNALGNLENAQGRKVGVISHTEQIRNQISPQIHLIKLPRDGQSKIEIN